MPTSAVPVHRFIYIAKERGSAANQYKVGKTRQNLLERMRSMGGQTEAVFDLIAAFRTMNEDIAEKLAHQRLDELNMRKRKGSRKETFVGDLDTMKAVCTQAAEQADRLYRIQVSPTPPPSPALSSNQRPLKSAHPLWRKVLSAPVTLSGKQCTLGELLGRAQSLPSARRRAEALGIRHKAHRTNAVEYEIDWAQAQSIVQWLKIENTAVPQTEASRFQVRH